MVNPVMCILPQFKKTVSVKINTQKPQLNRISRPGRKAFMPCNNRAHQEQESHLFFPGKDSANEKPWTLCYLNPPTFLFPSI